MMSIACSMHLHALAAIVGWRVQGYLEVSVLQVEFVHLRCPTTPGNCPYDHAVQHRLQLGV